MNEIVLQLRMAQDQLKSLEKELNDETKITIQLDGDLEEKQIKLRDLMILNNKTIDQKVRENLDKQMEDLVQETVNLQNLQKSVQMGLREKLWKLRELKQQKIEIEKYNQDQSKELNDLQNQNTSLQDRCDKFENECKKTKHQVDQQDILIQQLREKQSALKRQLHNMTDVKNVLNRFGAKQDLSQLERTVIQDKQPTHQIPQNKVNQQQDENDNFWFEQKEEFHLPQINQNPQRVRKL